MVEASARLTLSLSLSLFLLDRGRKGRVWLHQEAYMPGPRMRQPCREGKGLGGEVSRCCWQPGGAVSGDDLGLASNQILWARDPVFRALPPARESHVGARGHSEAWQIRVAYVMAETSPIWGAIWWPRWMAGSGWGARLVPRGVMLRAGWSGTPVFQMMDSFGPWGGPGARLRRPVGPRAYP